MNFNISSINIQNPELFSTFIWGFKQLDILKTINFFSVWLREQKMFLFEHVIDIRDAPTRPGPARPDQAMTLIEGLFLTQLKRTQFNC